jgi:hypothetical protein
VSSGAGNVLRENKSFGGLDLFRVASSTIRTEVIGNVAIGAERDGLVIEAPGTLLRRNTANNNGRLGINAVPGVIDAGGNRASGNGNPLQCVNVFCQ